ncbi:MAG: sugar ABC transporter permease [Thermotogota bacterium]|nr:sugar ABC transporter permease [Thermotogota bacterium]
MFDLSKHPVNKMMIIAGLFLIVISFFLPYASGNVTYRVTDFSFWGTINLLTVYVILLALFVLFFLIKRIAFLLAAAVSLFTLNITIIFMRTEWQDVLRSKFFFDFFKIGSFGWWISLIGSAFILIAVVRLIPDKKRAPYLFILPAICGVFFLTFFPAMFAFFISFHRWNILVPNKPFVGLANFKKAFSDEYFLRSLWISFKYAIGVIPTKIVISFFFALLIYSIPKFKSVFRVIYFLPAVTSVVAISVIWNWIYHPYYGVANYLISLFGFDPIDWLGNPDIAIWSVVLVSVWRSVGYSIIIFLAGLNNIPRTILEASDIDGASRWQKVKNIIIPLMKPSLVFVFITSTIGAIQVFTEIYMMTGGNADTKTAVFYIWQTGFNKLQMGYASSMSIVLFGIILVITLIQMRVTRIFKED